MILIIAHIIARSYYLSYYVHQCRQRQAEKSDPRGGAKTESNSTGAASATKRMYSLYRSSMQ